MKIAFALGGAAWLWFTAWTLRYFSRRAIWRDRRPFVRANVLVGAPANALVLTVVAVTSVTHGLHDPDFWPVMAVVALYSFPASLWVWYAGGVLMQAALGSMWLRQSGTTSGRGPSLANVALQATNARIPLMPQASLRVTDDESLARACARRFFLKAYRRSSAAWHVPTLLLTAFAAWAAFNWNAPAVVQWVWMTQLALALAYPVLMFAGHQLVAVKAVRQGRERRVEMGADGLTISRGARSTTWKWDVFDAPWEFPDAFILPLGRQSYIWLPRLDLPGDVAQAFHEWRIAAGSGVGQTRLVCLAGDPPQT